LPQKLTAQIAPFTEDYGAITENTQISRNEVPILASDTQKHLLVDLLKAV